MSVFIMMRIGEAEMMVYNKRPSGVYFSFLKS
jgi:hypothetical protein